MSNHNAVTNPVNHYPQTYNGVDVPAKLYIARSGEDGRCRVLDAGSVEELKKSVASGNGKWKIFEYLRSGHEYDLSSTITGNSANDAKVDLFMSLFRGRSDVYARRWESRDGQRSGYSPVCRNEWAKGICEKPKIKCADCTRRELVPIDKQVAVRHLSGKEVVGIYPMLQDETCWFLAIDFDDDGWRRDVAAIRAVCDRNLIPAAVERSRSGNGAHVWLFFDELIPAPAARKLGSAILTIAMQECHEIKFKSYDRLFPNQDTMPKGGFGNLIALPLQRKARDCGNSVFVDEDFLPYRDQWDYLNGVKRLSLSEAEGHAAMLCKGGELGNLQCDDDDETATAPWRKKTPTANLNNTDFPCELRVVEGDMLYIEKNDLSHKALNDIKRLAAFKNPEFYKAQAMRFPTWDKPRVISISEETKEYLCLPRGCKDDLTRILDGLDVSVIWQDERNAGRTIQVSFNGVLRDEQAAALEKLLEYDNGILAATTAFGKTVVASALIAARQVNTLVLVNRQPLLDQWKTRLTEFLIINEDLPETEKKRGRKKERCVIGQLGGGKNTLGGIIDIAVMQSLVHGDEVKEIVKDYGMVIVDECHHVSAASFERVLKNVTAKYVYGMTATPKRQDGHHPVIYMHCGRIRYKDDAKFQAVRRPFGHFVIPRFTPFRVPIEKDEAQIPIQELYNEICQSEVRNSMIVDDVIKAAAAGRNSLILTERKTHIMLLESAMKQAGLNVITLVGGKSAGERKRLIEKVDGIPAGSMFVIIATGKYVGEGFDIPRLDTLFLAMPIAWQGTLAQYAGRLHRVYDDKREVLIYDYVDIHVTVLDRMYAKRVKGYAAIGYKTKDAASPQDSGNIIFDTTDFLPAFVSDLLSARSNVVIVSPFLTKNRIAKMRLILDEVLSNKADVTVVTRSADDCAEKDRARIVPLIQTLTNCGITVIERTRIHQKFAVVDERVSWYGDIDFLGFGKTQGSVMRLESKSVAGGVVGGSRTCIEHKIAGFEPADVAPFFRAVADEGIDNVWLPERFAAVLR